MGRKALPTEIKRLKGTLRKCRMNPLEPEPTDDIGEPPEYMSERAKEFWRSTLVNMPKGVIKKCDSAVFESFCNALAMREKIQKEVDRLGMVSGGKVSGQLNALMKVEALLAKAGSELGLTPSSRQKVAQGYGDPTNPDGFTMDMFAEFDMDDRETADA